MDLASPRTNQYRVLDVSSLSFDEGRELTRLRGGLVTHHDWCVSYQAIDRVFSSPSVVAVDDGLVTLSVFQYHEQAGGIGDASFAYHPLNGTKYRTQDEASRAAYEAGVLAYMVYYD